jgi:hypothetical protein
MSAPSLRRDGHRWGYRCAYCLWWSYGRGNGARHQHKDHQPSRHERKGKHPQGKPCAVACGRAGCPRRIPARRFALAGVRPVVEARTGDGCRRVRSALGIGANPKATNADGSPHAGFGQVQPERPKFDALTKSPCHVPAILPPASTAPGELAAPICGEPCLEPPEAGAIAPARNQRQRRDGHPAAPAPRPGLTHQRRGIPSLAIQRRAEGNSAAILVRKASRKTVGEIVGSVVEFGGSPHSKLLENAVNGVSLKSL